MGSSCKAYKQECAGGSHRQCSFAPVLGAGSYIVITHFLVHHDGTMGEMTIQFFC